MEFIPVLIILVLIATGLALAFNWRTVVVFEHERGLLYKNGKFASVLEPGRHTYFVWTSLVRKIDVRAQHITLPGQEVLSADNIGMKISLVTSYKVVDPYLAMNQVANYGEALYLTLQVNLRDVVGSLPVDDLLAKREEIGKAVFERSVQKATELGVELSMVNVRDIMFPGDLKNIFAQVVNARKEGLAALERARGESAALRNLANAARLLDGNPNLRQLRLLQTLENKSGNTIVLLGDTLPGLQRGEAKPEGPEPE